MDPVKNILGKNFECEVCEGKGGKNVRGKWKPCENCDGKGYG